VSVGDVPADYHASTAGGDFLGIKLDLLISTGIHRVAGQHRSTHHAFLLTRCGVRFFHTQVLKMLVARHFQPTGAQSPF
ncbi:hypothetical protein LOS10_22135, partial [Proteus mirabilis]